MGPLRRYEEQVRSAYALAREEQIPAIAAGLAYYEFNSLIPFGMLLLIALAAVGQLKPALAELQVVVGSGVAGQLVEELSVGGAARLRAAAIATLILVWSAMRLLRTVDGVFVEMYGERSATSALATVVDLVIALVTFVVAIGLLVVVGVVLSSEIGGLWLSLLAPLLLFLGLLVAFFPMYYVFPAARTSVAEALPGTVLAAAGWTVSGVFFGLYARVSESVQLYGAAGGLLLLLTWLYVGGFLILTGVVLNASIAGHVDLDRAS